MDCEEFEGFCQDEFKITLPKEQIDKYAIIDMIIKSLDMTVVYFDIGIEDKSIGRLYIKVIIYIINNND